MVLVPAADEPSDWVSADVVQDRALQLGLQPRQLRRYSAAGLLAACRQPGLGYARGRIGWYPVRALAQVEAIARVRPHRVSAARLRQLVWFQAGGALEAWELWRDDGITELCPSSLAFALPALHDDDFPERDHAIVELAAFWGSRPGHQLSPLLPKHLNDRETLAEMFLSLAKVDDLLMPLAEAGDAADARLRLRAILSTPVDAERGQTLGELIDRSVGGTSVRPFPGMPGEVVVALYGFAPRPATAAIEFAVLSETEAVRARDLLLVIEARGAQRGARLRDLPVVAALLTLWMHRLITLYPPMAEVLTAPP
jgi:hypothetical protein